MHKTKMIKVYFPAWQLWSFSLTVSLLVLAIQPQLIVAQANTNPATAQTDNNPAIADLEPEILSEINRVRTTPQDYAQWLEQQRQYYDGIWLKLPGEKPVRTNRGREALEEAITFLKQQQPLPPLARSPQTDAAAISELENFANSNNIQYFSYGRKTASGIVMDLVVDELFPDRRRRQSLLSTEAEDTGVVCKPDPRYAKVCAIAYSDSPGTTSETTSETTDVAQVQPQTPTVPTTTEETVTELPAATPSVKVPVAEPPVVPPVPDEQPVVEAPVEAPAEATLQPEEPEVATAPAEATPDNETVANLPAPPQPQTPPTPTVKDEPEPSSETKASLEEDLQIAQAESEIEEIEEEQAKLAANDDAATEESNQPEEVAINTEVADFSEKVEEGKLEKGDRIIADDGSLYDFYPMQGKEGESFTIDLESDQFDTFVALVDSSGKTVGENDDISQDDNNSRLEVTLPEDGIYNVIVNTYDENGTGEYVLKVSR
jgi:Bacterial pre-peptidase C-terminal domain